VSIGDIRGMLQYAVESQFQLVNLIKKVDEMASFAITAMQNAIEAKRTSITSPQQSDVHGAVRAFIKTIEEIRDLTAGTACRELASGSVQKLQQAFTGSQHVVSVSAITVAEAQLQELDELQQMSTNLISDVENLTGFTSEDPMVEAATEVSTMAERVPNFSTNAINLLNYVNDYLSSIGAAPLDTSSGNHGNGS